MLLFSSGEANIYLLYTYEIRKCKTFMHKTILIDLE